MKVIFHLFTGQCWFLWDWYCWNSCRSRVLSSWMVCTTRYTMKNLILSSVQPIFFFQEPSRIWRIDRISIVRKLHIFSFPSIWNFPKKILKTFFSPQEEANASDAVMQFAIQYLGFKPDQIIMWVKKMFILNWDKLW